MRILACDDEKLALKLLVKSITEAVPDAEVQYFQDASEALEYAKSYKVDVAFLDIQMLDISGIELARRLIRIIPNINIIFVTGFTEYRGDAFDLHASGYITKPVTTEKVKNEMKYLRYQNVPDENATFLLKAQCFGTFDCKDYKGNPIHFARSKAKELLAYLIYRQGASSTAKEIAASIFEDSDWSPKEQTYFRQLILTLSTTLKSIGAESVLIKDFNSFAVNVNLVDCDYYDLVLRKKAPQNFMGEFMTQYYWAEDAIFYIQEMIDNM